MMKTSLKVVLSAAAAAALLVAGGAAHASKEASSTPTQFQVAKASIRVKGAAGTGAAGTGISYHGGPVMTSGITVYPIWYGNVSDSTKSVISGFLGNVGGSSYFNINTTYNNSLNKFVQNSVTLSPLSYSDPKYSAGKALSDAAVQNLVKTALKKALPTDPNGFYLVITAPDVTETSGFLTQYCGWHTYTRIGASAIKYSFVGDPTNGMSACAQQTTSPNGNAPADAMVSVVAHELEEAATDPQLNAWYDSNGYENADKCAWTFGTTSTASNGSLYNVTIGSAQYLIQQNWVNAGSGGCALSY